MDDTASVLNCDVISGNNLEGSLLLKGSKVWEERLVGHSYKVISLYCPKDPAALSILPILSKKVGGKIVVGSVSFILNFHIFDFRSHCQGKVGRKGPRSCGPGKEIGVFGAVNLEADSYSLVNYILISAKGDFHV